MHRTFYIKILSLFAVIIFYINTSIYAQDIHFSQFFATPLFNNPANTGFFDGDFRFVLNQKNQWNSFTNAYKTYAGSFDASFKSKLIYLPNHGAGLLINQDIAGDGKLNTTHIYLNYGLRLNIPNIEKLQIGIGLNLGYIFHSINFNNFRFGSQYDGEQFNQYLPTNELWTNNKMSYFDFGSGVLFHWSQNSRFNLAFSISSFHINQAKRSFYGNTEIYLPVKWTYNIFGEYNIKDDLWIEPHFLFLKQQKYSEINLGAILRFDYNPLTFQSFYSGMIFRTRDAGILVFGFNYNNFKFSISYDINLSKLSGVSKGRGGAEFSLIYVLSKLKPFEAPFYKKCPDFM